MIETAELSEEVKKISSYLREIRLILLLTVLP